MFKQKDYEYFSMAQKKMDTYLINSGDQLTIKIYARDGFKLIDVLGGQSEGNVAQTSTVQTQARSYTFLVDNEGFVKLPVVGDFFVKGFSEVEMERKLAEKYAGLFVDPWVSVKVFNRRVLVFRATGANIVTLEDYPISLIEVIARSGGLESDAKAYKIKVIRGDIKNPQVTLVDLSTLEGIRRADLSIQPNDIILIEKRRRIVSDVMKEISPYLGAITTVTTLIILFRTRFGQ